MGNPRFVYKESHPEAPTLEYPAELFSYDIVFTSYPYPQYRDKCLKAGADFFFDKSCDVEQLLQVLNALVQNMHAATGGKLCRHAE